jgi:hypothetical protein
METEKEGVIENKQEENTKEETTPVEIKQNQFQASIGSFSFENVDFNNPEDIVSLL